MMVDQKVCSKVAMMAPWMENWMVETLEESLADCLVAMKGKNSEKNSAGTKVVMTDT